MLSYTNIVALRDHVDLVVDRQYHSIYWDATRIYLLTCFGTLLFVILSLRCRHLQKFESPTSERRKNWPTPGESVYSYALQIFPATPVLLLIIAFFALLERRKQI